MVKYQKRNNRSNWGSHEFDVKNLVTHIIIDATTYQPITVTRFVSLIGFWEPPGS